MRKILLGTALILSMAVLSYGRSPSSANQWHVGSGTYGAELDSTGNLLPMTDDTGDVGSSTYQWQDGYFDGTVDVDGITNTGTLANTGDMTNSGSLTNSGAVYMGAVATISTHSAAGALDLHSSLEANGITNAGSAIKTGINGNTIYELVIATTVADAFDYVPTCNAKAGWGNINISGGIYGAQFSFTSAGAVTLVLSSGTTTSNGNDGTLNIHDGGTGIVLENQSGGAATIFGTIYYIN